MIYSLDPHLPYINNLFRSYLKSDEELQSETKSFKELLKLQIRMWNMRYREEEIESKFDPSLSLPNLPSEREKYERMKLESKPEEILEKYAILSYLVSNKYLNNVLDSGNIFTTHNTIILI